MVERDALAESRLKIDVCQLAVVDPGRGARREGDGDGQGLVSSLNESQTITHLHWYLFTGRQINLSVNITMWLHGVEIPSVV